MEIASEKPGICSTGGFVLNNSADPTQSSTFSSDNCSLCLSEGDNNTSSSNHENTESSIPLDSEDVSRQSEVRNNLDYMEKILSDCHEHATENSKNTNGEGLVRSSNLLTGPSLDGTRNYAFGNLKETAQSFDTCFSTANVRSQPQSMLPLLANHDIHFPMFQSPSTMGYFHQNPVSWPGAPTNGLVPFPHTNPYLYASPLGYGLNEDPRFCLQYGALQQPAPIFNPAVPVHQPVARPSVLNAELRSRVSKPASLPQHHGYFAERVVTTGTISKKPALYGEVMHDNSAKSLENNDDFSLFHFGGPVALSTGCKSVHTSLNGDSVGDFGSKGSADHVENVHNCNKKETPAMEEYNLFATSNKGFQFLK